MDSSPINQPTELQNSQSNDFIESSNLVEKKIGHNKLQVEIDKLSAELAEKNKLIDDLQSQLTNSNQKCTSIEALNTQLNLEKSQLTEQLNTAQNTLQNSVSTDQYNASKEQLSKLSTALAAQVEDFNSLQTLYNDSQKLYDEASALVQELEFSNTNLQNNFDQLSAEYAVSIEQNNSYKNEINALQNNIDSHIAEINSLKDQISHSKTVALQLNTIIEEKNKELDTLASETVPVVPEFKHTGIKGNSVRPQRSRR